MLHKTTIAKIDELIGWAVDDMFIDGSETEEEQIDIQEDGNNRSDAIDEIIVQLNKMRGN